MLSGTYDLLAPTSICWFISSLYRDIIHTSSHHYITVFLEPFGDLSYTTTSSEFVYYLLILSLVSTAEFEQLLCFYTFLGASTFIRTFTFIVQLNTCSLRSNVCQKCILPPLACWEPCTCLEWPITSRMSCLVSIFAEFLGYVYLSLKC